MRQGVRLGIDPGQARMGIAACDPAGILASPLETYTVRDKSRHEIIRHVLAIARERDAIEIVVGRPVHLNGSVGESARAAESFASALARRAAPIEVRMVDERRSSVQAHGALHEAGKDGRAQRMAVDRAAAAIILQQALDQERATGHAAGLPVKQEQEQYPQGKDTPSD